MSVQIDIVYRGELRTEAVHEPSGTALLTDAPRDNHGRGESFSPSDLVATALGSCMVTIMGIVAKRHGWNLEGTTVTVTKEMAQIPVRRISRLTVVISVPTPLEQTQRALLEKAAFTCPVHQSLHPDIEIPVEFQYAS